MIKSERNKKSSPLWRQSLEMHRAKFPKYHWRMLIDLERDSWQVFVGI